MAQKKRTGHYINRELSWLAFNQRVLAEAKDSGNPLLERLKFCAIAASNLDEFLMVRAGGLHMARKAGRRQKDPSGMTPLMQLREVHTEALVMMRELHHCFTHAIEPGLAEAGIRHVASGDVVPDQEHFLFELFTDELYPVVTPLAVVDGKRFPLPRDQALQMLVRLRAKRGGDDARYAVLQLDRAGERIVPLPSDQGQAYVLIEEVALRHLGQWFPGYEILETVLFRVTRNADFAVQEDEAADLLVGIEDVLEERKAGDCVRLEVASDCSRSTLRFLCRNLSVASMYVYPLAGALNLRDFMGLVSLPGFDELRSEAWAPQRSSAVVPSESMLAQVARRDMLFYHPYESFDPVVRFIEEAAADPDVMAIKMVLYRTSSRSAIVDALKRAAERGISVTVLMELKARFDEARNITRARELEQVGAQVVYGVKGYKTHAKICLVVRREPTGVVRYCHFGTGNYNEATARLYGDISYLTANPELGADASAFFNALCGYAQPRRFNMISMAPVNLRERLLELIDVEIERARKGKRARIMVKLNALVDVALIDRLYLASQAGVNIALNIRGICCLRPGVAGLSENIVVTSIVDRFLEHARIIYFHHGGDAKLFISSADWMPRNLDRRLELLVPVDDEVCKARLIELLEVHLADTQSSWVLGADGGYTRRRLSNGGLRSQAECYRRAVEARVAASDKQRTRFRPHRSEP